MAYTAPTTRSTGDLITSTIWNTDMVDNIVYLKSSINAQIQIPGGAWYPRVTTGAAPGSFETTTNKNNFNTIDFSNTGGALYAQFANELPADYNGGTVTFHVNWTCQNASTNSVLFVMQATSYSNDDTLDAAYGSAVGVVDANLANGDLNKSAESAALTIAGAPAAGDTVLWQFYRSSGDAQDNLAATARVLSVTITYTRS